MTKAQSEAAKRRWNSHNGTLTTQQKEDLEWVAQHKENVLLRNKALKYAGLAVLYILISIGNYYLLKADNISTFAQGLTAFGFELALWIVLLSAYLKILKRISATNIIFASDTTATTAFAIALTSAVAFAPVFALTSAVAFAPAFAVVIILSDEE